MKMLLSRSACMRFAALCSPHGMEQRFYFVTVASPAAF
jgi:hypothetical protein